MVRRLDVTHDLATRDSETGALRLRGRVDHHGHAHVDLLEIEAVLRAHEHVTEAVVLGVDPTEAHVASANGKVLRNRSRLNEHRVTPQRIITRHGER